jgi:hypothetical protein
VGRGPKGALEAAVAGRQGQQDGAAALGGQFEAAEGEEELEAQRGPARPAAWRRRRCGAVLGGKGVGAGAVGLVAQEEVAVAGVELLQRLSEGVALFSLQGERGARQALPAFLRTHWTAGNTS